MLSHFFRHPSTRSLLLFLALFVLCGLFAEMSRYGLPEAKSVGYKDDQTAALALLGLLCCTWLLPARAGRPLFVLILGLATAFTVANWWFYGFYRDYIDPGNLKLAIYAGEGTLAWDGLPHKGRALLFAATMLAGTLLVFALDRWRPLRRWTLVLALAIFALAAQQQMNFLSRSTGGLAHRGVNHFGYFVRGLFDNGQVGIDASHLASLKRLFPNRVNADTPGFPLFQPGADAQARPGKNVLLIVLESVRSAESFAFGRLADATQTLTPHLDALTRHSLMAGSAYANSNQTVRGEVAILCSAIDYLNGAPYSVGGVPIKTNCLPSMLASLGYTTHWIHGYKQDFFNRDAFFPQLGFQQLHDRQALIAAGATREIGWGVADQEMFDYALRTLERSPRPFFAEVLTLSNHYPYLWDWDMDFPPRLALPADFEPDSEFVYPAYRRGIYYTDHALGRFLRKFRASSLYADTLLIVVGDHGIWSFPRRLERSRGLNAELQRNETYFRVPLLLHAADLPPGRIDSPVSQIDIAPTVLDYLGIELDNAFLGRSLLGRESDRPSPIFFVAGGSFGLRHADARCFPIDEEQACSSAYRQCDGYRKREARQWCVETDLDLLSPALPELQPSDYDLADSRKVIELTQHWLKHGFMPEASLYPQSASAGRRRPARTDQLAAGSTGAPSRPRARRP